MTVAADLAQAARRVRALNERLPVECRIDLAADWQALREHVHVLADPKARQIIFDWIAEIEERIELAAVEVLR